jgi:hypothetical protein
LHRQHPMMLLQPFHRYPHRRAESYIFQRNRVLASSDSTTRGQRVHVPEQELAMAVMVATGCPTLCQYWQVPLLPLTRCRRCLCRLQVSRMHCGNSFEDVTQTHFGHAQHTTVNFQMCLERI